MSRVRIPLTATKASDMPPACIICGATVDDHVSRTFTWRPSFVSIGFWVSLVGCFPVALVLLVIGLANTRRATLEVPVCDRHRHYWLWRGFLAFAPLFALAATDLILAILLLTKTVPMTAFPLMLIATALVLLVWALVTSLLRRGGPKAEEITDDDIILAPVHQTFGDLWRFSRRRRGAAADDGLQDYDPYPRRPVVRPRVAK